MTPPLTLPADPGEFARHVARLWRVEAIRAGLDPREEAIGITDGGRLYAEPRPIEITGLYDSRRDAARPRAIAALADALEDECGMAVAREGGSFRVLGWAAVMQYGQGGAWVGPVRLIDIEARDVRDPRAVAWRDALVADRLARRAAAQGPADAPGARSRGDAARVRGARR